MGERGCSHHIRRSGEPEQALLELGGRYAVLGSNERWLSFLELDEPALDVAQAARSAAAPAITVWFDEDLAVVLQAFAPDGWKAELSMPLDGSDGELSENDARFVAQLAERDLVPPEVAESLLEALRLPPDEREGWLRSHGIEELLGLPHVAPMPLPCNPEIIAILAPAARVIGSGQRAWPRRGSGEADPASRRGDPDPAVVDLHVCYWARMWMMNDWTLYNRYKKHLPAERRSDVDALVNEFMKGAPESRVRELVEAILAATWGAEDWVAMIRHPRVLGDATRFADERRVFEELLKAAEAAR